MILPLVTPNPATDQKSLPPGRVSGEDGPIVEVRRTMLRHAYERRQHAERQIVAIKLELLHLGVEHPLREYPRPLILE